MKLPFSRVVNVNVSRNSGFPSRRGFGVALFLTSTEVAGELDASNLTKVYGSLSEVAADFDTTSDFYKAAAAAFGQNPRPIQIKAGFYVRGSTDPTPEQMATAIGNIIDRDSDWYWLCVETLLRDSNSLDGLVAWVEAQNKQLIIDSNDTQTQISDDTTSIAGRHKGTVERTSVCYHPNNVEHMAFALAATLGTFVFDDDDSAYTAKFKRLEGISPVNIGSAAVEAVTGFVPNLGQSTGAGNCANTYVDIGGVQHLTEGSTLTPNVFIDEIHATDFIIARTEEEMLSLLARNNRIPYTDVGMQQLASVPRKVMEIARNAGLIADDLNEETGEFQSSVVIDVPLVSSTTQTQRNARIAPAIAITFRYAGAVHYTTVNYKITF